MSDIIEFFKDLCVTNQHGKKDVIQILFNVLGFLLPVSLGIRLSNRNILICFGYLIKLVHHI